MGLKRQNNVLNLGLNWGSELTNWAFIPWATLASVQEFNKNILAPIILPLFCWSISEWGQCPRFGQYHTVWNTGFSLEFPSIITFVFSHKGGGPLRSTTVPVSCNNPNVTTYLPEFFVTFPFLSTSTFLWFTPQSFLLGYLAAFPHSSKAGGSFLSEPSELTSFLRHLFACMRPLMTSVVLQYWVTFWVLPRTGSEYKYFHEGCGPISDSGEVLQKKKFRNIN